MGDYELLHLADSEDWFATGGTSAFDGRPAILQFDLLGVLNLPVLLLLVYAVACDQLRVSSRPIHSN